MGDESKRQGTGVDGQPVMLDDRLYRRHAGFPNSRSIGDDLIQRHGSFLEKKIMTVANWSLARQTWGGMPGMEWFAGAITKCEAEPTHGKIGGQSRGGAQRTDAAGRARWRRSDFRQRCQCIDCAGREPGK